MKKLSNQEIAHEFFYQENDQRENKNGSMFFNADTFYSYGYHFIIAKKVRNKKTKEVDFVLFNSNGYSNTTAKQQSLVGSANPFKAVYVSTDIENFNPLNEVLDIEKKLISVAESISRMRSNRNINFAVDSIQGGIKKIKFIIEYYRIKSKLPKRIKDLLSADDFLSYLDIAAIKLTAANKKAAKIAAKKAAAKKAEEIRKEKEKIDLWKKGELNRLYKTWSIFDFLRLKSPDSIETSQGVTITIDEFKRAYKLLKLGKLLGTKIDEKYSVDHINGTIKIGCHNIELNEVERINKLIS